MDSMRRRGFSMCYTTILPFAAFAVSFSLKKISSGLVIALDRMDRTIWNAEWILRHEFPSILTVFHFGDALMLLQRNPQSLNLKKKLRTQNDEGKKVQTKSNH